MTTNKTKKNDIMYSCTFCDFNTCKKTDFTRHFATQKHKINTSATSSHDKNENTKKYLCEFCEKSYNDRTGLWKHKKKCKNEVNSDSEGENTVISNSNEIQELKEFMKYLMKENSDMKSMMMEVIKNGTHNNNSHTTNSHNKAFNLQFFLNETCKNAMNINDFVESIQLQVSDLENVGELGFVEGISNIIVKNLNALDVTQRPIHCTDKKRETIYIKDENVWEKDESQCKMRKAIKKVVTKNMRLIPKFREKYPDYNKSSSKTSDRYNKLIIESMGGSGDNDAEKEDKIVRNIVKNVVVDKATEEVK